MNKNIKKITMLLAVMVFLFALAINVKVSLDDPFLTVGETLIAETTSTSTTGQSCQGHNNHYIYQDCPNGSELKHWIQDLYCGAGGSGKCYSGASRVDYACGGSSTIIYNTIMESYCQ